MVPLEQYKTAMMITFMSNNGRIRKKTGYSRDHVRYTDQSQKSLNNGDHYELYQSYGDPNLNQHNVMNMVRHMVKGTMITEQHVLVLIPQVRLDMGTSPGGQKSADRVVMAGLSQICTTMIITEKSWLLITLTMVITHNRIILYGPFREFTLQPKTEQWICDTSKHTINDAIDQPFTID